MDDPPPATSESKPGTGYASIALRGTAWATGQLIVNKVATVAATWIVSRCMGAGEFGAAALALTAAKFVCIFPPLNMGDVLIARSESIREILSDASKLVLAVSLALMVLGMSMAPAVAAVYAEYPWGLLVGLVIVASIRPFGEALQVGPQTILRLDFRNRGIALIDGLAQFVSTVTGVVLALLGAGAWSVVIPSVIVAFLRSAGYRFIRAELPQAQSAKGRPGCAVIDRRQVRSQFFAAGGAQYVHSVVDSLPLLLLGCFSSAEQIGLFAFAVSLSGQANTLVATQVSSVLQPVLGRLRHDADRQAKGYLRTLSTLSALAVPVCLTQAIFGAALFSLVFDVRWQAAAPVFAAMSILESFFFASAPTMAMLKARGKFRTFLAWQLLHLVVSIPVIAWSASRGGALGVAVGAASLWALSLPIATWLSVRDAGLGLAAAVRVFLAPWSTALPIGCAAWFGSQWLCHQGRIGQAGALLGLAPLTLLLMLLASRWSQPAVYQEVGGLLAKLLGRLPFLRRLVTRPGL
jgi:O-antigen/teichoic acid export membrane protein